MIDRHFLLAFVVILLLPISAATGHDFDYLECQKTCVVTNKTCQGKCIYSEQIDLAEPIYLADKEREKCQKECISERDKCLKACDDNLIEIPLHDE